MYNRDFSESYKSKKSIMNKTIPSYHPKDAIRSLGDLKVGEVYYEVCSCCRFSEAMKIVELLKDKFRWERISPTYSFISSPSSYYCDLGVIPYDTGKWNRSNFLLGRKPSDKELNIIFNEYETDDE